ncbi:LOW QUALITY PROTEIN: stathmin domain-containing protein 1 [Centrocercus urophasianus]|uniref:LOW QUALITY PROTEIN: stathmin domain-containing protein 1 n=1 Tax=Centrocercus urophasianus TaxID=9002 RepID=UPI001C64A65E|nr:LOW QUALITY PROTEIN: stathmin domain-containing protein 1 [Centrocercus urophasianus]
MGCNTSKRVAAAQLSSEELQNNHEARIQTTSDSADKTRAATSHEGAAWTGDTSENGSKLEVEASEGGFHEKSTERFTPSEKRSNAQSTDALLTSGFISKSRPLQETERQKSSDILEELRMQGIIGSQSTAARTGEAHENKRDALEKMLKKPPARLEKMWFGNKEVKDFTAKDMKAAGEKGGKVREKELNRRPQHIAFYPATARRTTGKQTEKDCPSFQSQESTDAPQSSPLHGEINVLLQEITAEETTNYYTEDFTIESDITYNCINETIWI